MPTKDYSKQEKKKLLKLLSSSPPDINSIKEHVWMENGLLGMSVRKSAWLLFLGEDPSVILTCPDYSEEYREQHQIEVDILRSFVHFEGHDSLDAETLKSHRSKLCQVIKAVLMEDETLYYYQGFHDIAEFFLLVSDFDLNWTYTILKSLTRQYLKDYMHPNMSEVEKLLQLLYPILELRCKELVPILQNPEKSPIVILPWIITLFTHSLTSLRQVARLFDVMLLHPLMPLYVAASVVLHFKRELQLTQERYQVYQILGKLNKYSLPLEKIIRIPEESWLYVGDTRFFYEALPPSNAISCGKKQGIELSKDSMILTYEKKAFQAQMKEGLLKMIIHPGNTPVGETTVGFISVAAIGLAIATLFQLVSNI